MPGDPLPTPERLRRRHERWLLDLTALPTVAGCEDRAVAWIARWVDTRPDLRLTADPAGNLVITPRRPAGGRSRIPPVFITAHLDHPGFVVLDRPDRRTAALEFRGGVSSAYFENAALELFDKRGRSHRATIASIDASARPFIRAVAGFDRETAAIRPGDIGRWALDDALSLPRVVGGLLYTYACDDLAAVAAALAALDLLRTRGDCRHVGLLFTRAEEIGFVGATACCKAGAVPRRARLICLENSRSFAESPIGGGPVVRVGDRTSVFGPALTNRISAIAEAYGRRRLGFMWQRKLMAGGTCEATTFSTFGYAATCLCLPLGNYHNMVDIERVEAGTRPATVGPEIIALADFRGLVELLVVAVTELDAPDASPLRHRLETLFETHRHLVRPASAPRLQRRRRQNR